MPARGHPIIQSTPTDLRRAVRAAEAKIHGHGPDLVPPREYSPVCERPVWNPAKDRAWVAVMERLGDIRGTVSMGRK